MAAISEAKLTHTPVVAVKEITDTYGHFFSIYGSFHYLFFRLLYASLSLDAIGNDQDPFRGTTAGTNNLRLQSLEKFYQLQEVPNITPPFLNHMIAKDEHLSALWGFLKDRMGQDFLDYSLQVLCNPDLKKELPFDQILQLPPDEKNRDQLLATYQEAAEDMREFLHEANRAAIHRAYSETGFDDDYNSFAGTFDPFIEEMITILPLKLGKSERKCRGLFLRLLQPLMSEFDKTHGKAQAIQDAFIALSDPKFKTHCQNIRDVTPIDPFASAYEARLEKALSNPRLLYDGEGVIRKFDDFLNAQTAFEKTCDQLLRFILIFRYSPKTLLRADIKDYVTRANLIKWTKEARAKVPKGSVTAKALRTVEFGKAEYTRFSKIAKFGKVFCNQMKHCAEVLRQLDTAKPKKAAKRLPVSLPASDLSKTVVTVSDIEFAKKILGFQPTSEKKLSLFEALKECSFTQPVNRAHFEHGLDHLRTMTVILGSREPTKHNLILTAITAQWALEEATVAFMGERNLASTEEDLIRFKTHNLTQLGESDFLKEMTKIEQHLRRPSEIKNESLIGRIMRAEEIEELQQEIAMETYRAFARFAGVKWNGKAPRVKSVSKAEPLPEMEHLVDELSDRANEDIRHHIESMRSELRSFNPKDARQMALFNTVMRRAIYLIIELQLQKKGGRTNYETLVERADIDFGGDEELERFVKEAHQDFFAIRYGIHSSRACVRSSAQVARTRGELHRQEDNPDGFEVAISRSTQRTVEQQDTILEEVKRNLELLLKFSCIMEGLL